MVLTDHSPRLKVANGLTPERLREQLGVVAGLNEELAPFRILTGIEVDILEDGGIDQEPELLAQLDVVVASVHSKLRMTSDEMTPRMVAADRQPATSTSSATAPGATSMPRAAAARCGRSRSSTPSSSSRRARSSTSRSRSTAGPSARTRPSGCYGWPSRPAARSPSTPTRTRQVS